ncbi:hypothetical protein ACFQ9J_26160 [Streptomyces sp. NPDC056529]|uniref:hypothetical protein n=1 Tax=Streptomyces sp. NPDC056529 TaxID=3345855 RepID=UPI003692CF8A
MAEAQRTPPSDLFTELSRYRVPLMEWVPANLDEAGVERLGEVLRISQEDGVCLAWAPRTEIVVGLLERTSRQERQKYLVAHREEIADDVAKSLNEVDHPALTDHVTFLRHAAAYIREHHDTTAQALLGNVLDTVMAHHGRRWIRETFPDATFPGTGSHKTAAGAIATRPSDSDLRLMMITPHLLLSSLQDVFGPEDKQDTFNRHLGAHQASADSYRSAFAVAALLITHTLLRQMDRYLHASE